MASGVAEEYWPDMAGLEYRDTVTDLNIRLAALNASAGTAR